MSCFTSDIYKNGRYLVSGIDSKKFVYILPKGADVKNAVRDLIIEQLSRENKWSFDVKLFYDYARDADFVSEEIAYTRQGKKYHKWIKNPYMFCSNKERREFVDKIIKDLKATKKITTKIKELPFSGEFL